MENHIETVHPGTPVPYAHTISRLYLDKPLPDLPSRSPTPLIGSTAWSDDSSTASLDDPDDSHSEASCPVFVRSGSDLVDGDGDRPVSTLTHDHDHDHDHKHPEPKPAGLSSWLAEDRYSYRPPAPTPPPHWNNRAGPNHYFREKKWDFFPELATPGALPENSPHSAAPRPKIKKDSVSRSASRWMPNPAEKGAALANDVRNSIRYLQRRWSRTSLDRAKSKRSQRPTTAPSSESSYTPRSCTAPPASEFDGSSYSPASPVSHEKEVLTQLSLSPTGSSISDQSILAQAESTKDQKRLAVPISPYQRYGAAIWDKSGREKKRLSYRQTPRVRFPKYHGRRKNRASQPKQDAFVAPLSPGESALSPGSGSGSGSWSRSGRTNTRKPLQQGTRYAVRALQGGTSQVLVAIDDARKKIARSGSGMRLRSGSGSKLDRKRSQLKSQIRLVGPADEYSHSDRDPWF